MSHKVEEFLAFPSDIWACLKIYNKNDNEIIGLAAIEKEGDNVYLHHIISKKDTDIKSLYFTILEDIRSYIIHQKLFIAPLGGYGKELYEDSIKHLKKEIVIPPSLTLTYNISIDDTQLPKIPPLEFFPYL